MRLMLGMVEMIRCIPREKILVVCKRVKSLHTYSGYYVQVVYYTWMGRGVCSALLRIGHHAGEGASEAQLVGHLLDY
jgi:hypothetical protein